MNVRVVLGLVLLVAALLSGWSLWQNRVREERAGPASGRSGYVLREFELTALGDDGKEAFTLRAPRLQETPGAKTMDLTTPLFLLPDDAGRYWEVRSRTGWVSDGQDEIRLRGDVDVRSPKGDARDVTMRTEELNVFPEQDRATSDAIVTITQPGSILRGRGLRVDLATKRYELLSQVRSRYVR
jgi:lipopolysaccharide export system protein LptC